MRGGSCPVVMPVHLMELSVEDAVIFGIAN